MKLIGCLALIAVLFACKTDEKTNNSQTEELTTLQSQLEQMKLDGELKDSVINESLSFFNEIQDNLVSIGIKEQSVRLKSENPELANDEKAMVLQEIKHINYLREENAKKVAQMQESMKSSGLKITELDNMISRLLEDIAAKDEQIETLRGELERKNEDYALLFDAYQQKDFQVESLSEEMNTAYFVYGTEKELEKNGVIDLKNGFIGIGKKVNLKDDFNEEYFTQVDIRSKKEILISGSKIQIISTHRPSSYDLKPSGSNTRLVIKDIREFWKVTKYLIVVVK
tara:strand:- start:85032 stop:85883 length:852 start_codon:yes stop_codon:yes gene_type:complete